MTELSQSNKELAQKLFWTNIQFQDVQGRFKKVTLEQRNEKEKEDPRIATLNKKVEEQHNHILRLVSRI